MWFRFPRAGDRSESTPDDSQVKRRRRLTLVMLMVPLFALGLWALHGRARRFYAEHLVASFYTYGFLLLWLAAGTVALTELFRAGLALGFGFTGAVLHRVLRDLRFSSASVGKRQATVTPARR